MTVEDLWKIDEELRKWYQPRSRLGGEPGDSVAKDIMDGLEQLGVWEDDVFVPNPEPEILEGDE